MPGLRSMGTSSTEEENSSSDSSDSSDFSSSDDDLQSAAIIELVRGTRYLSDRKCPEKMKYLTFFQSENQMPRFL